MQQVPLDTFSIKLSRLFTAYFILILLSSLKLSAGGGGSGYSRFGVGDIRYFPNERSAAMGGASIALLGTQSISTLNPAAWTQLHRMRFSIGAAYEGYTMNDGSGSSFLSDARFNGVSVAIPISTEDGVILSTGLTPYSTVNFNSGRTGNEPNYTYDLKQIGEGGLSNAHLGFSAAFDGTWHFGVKFNYLFGTLKHITEQNFTSPELTDAEVRRNTRMNGASATFGAIFSGVGELFNLPESHMLTIGTVFTTETRLTTLQENFYKYSVVNLIIGRDTIHVTEGTSSLPLAAGIGVSYTLKERFVLSGDLYYQNWKKFTLLGTHPPEYRDSYRISLGGEFLPRKEVAAAFLEKTAYRFGVFYYASKLRIAGTGINEIGITGGLGLPMFGETRFNIGVEYSIRGTMKYEKDNILRVVFTLNSGELWFVRPPEE